jgi:hypothetical protein
MEFVLLQVFNNYIDAHIVKGRLESEDIICHLKDEYLSGLIVDPILTNAIAGIKLMVAKEHAERALQILNEPPQPTQDLQ